MSAQIEVLDRISKFIPDQREVTVKDLRSLYVADPDALFKLAIDGVPETAPIAAHGFELLARTLSVLARDGFFVEAAANQKYARGHQGGFLALDDGSEDEAFLQSIYSGEAYTSKLEARVRSKECLDFFLEEHSWDSEVRSTQLLRVAPEDAFAIIGGLPRYQYLALLDCAREVVRNPTVAYRGLRHAGLMKGEGWAFFGRPSRWYMNDGSVRAPSNEFVFGVFVSPSGCVFDWDWVPASSKNPNLPRDLDERHSGNIRTDVHAELLLGNIRGKSPAPFKPQRAWYSAEGDCVFWYHNDAETYAAREDEYLTAFFQIDCDHKNKCLGFKLKMVSQLFETVERWADEDEGIQITFDADAVKVDLAFLMKAWVDANLPSSKELFPGMRLVEKLGEEAVKALREETPRFDIPRGLLREGRAMAHTSA